MQILKAQSRSELADHLRFTIKYKDKALFAYLAFFMIYSLLFTTFLYFLDWATNQTYLHWKNFIVGWIMAIVFPFPQGNFRGYRIPFLFEKYFIDQNLAEDLKALQYIKTTATIIDIKIPSKSFFKSQLHTLTLQLDESNKTITDQHAHLNLLFQNIYFSHSNYTKFYADLTWIGQKVEVCFLPKSKRIVQLIGLVDQDDFQSLSSDFLDQLHTRNKLTLKDIPSRFAQELFSIQKIEAVRQENNGWQYELIITSWLQNQYSISATCQVFAKLELMLASKIDFLKYRQFKQNPSIQSQTLYQRKVIKIPTFLSTQNRIFL